MNTADYLLENGGPGSIALISGANQYSYQDVKDAASRMVGELQKTGVEPGDRVGLLGNNSLFWVASYLAILKIGAVALPFATTLMPDEVGGMAAFVKVKATCAERRVFRNYSTVLPEPVLFDDLITQPGPQSWPSSSEINLDLDAALMFTSGTTARPRLVQVTHRNIQANTNSIIEYLELGKDDRVMAVLQFFYCFGTSLLHTHLRAGGSIVCSTSFVYPEVVLDMIEKNQCTGFAGVPSTYQTLLRNSTFKKRKLENMRKFQQAGGKLQTVLIQELVAAVPQAKVYVMYGQTEATARLSYLPPELVATKLGSIGKGIPGVTLKVIDDAGSEVKPGGVGEIFAWGENISPGYWNDPEATAPKFVNGVLHSGDLATVDEDGFIFVVDRKADFIKSFGYRVSSQRVEECIVEIPEVVGAAVIGEPDLVRGEAIWAFVVLKTGATLTARDIIDYCGTHLANYMVPKEVVFLKNLPMNAHGKIVKNELRKLAAEKSSEPNNISIK
jgi:long-chain acyl-CoA synthetase